MSDSIQSISQGNYILHNIDAKKLYVQEPLFTANSGDAVYVGWRPDETVLWESNTAWSGGNTGMKANFTLSEQVSAFDKVDIYFWKKYGSYLSYEVATTPVISNTIQYCVDPFPENMLTGSWFNMKLYGSGDNCGYSGGFNSVQSQSMTGWASQDMWSHGNIYKLVGVNRKENA